MTIIVGWVRRYSALQRVTTFAQAYAYCSQLRNIFSFYVFGISQIIQLFEYMIY